MTAVSSADCSHLAVSLRDRVIPGHFQKSFCTHLGLMHSELSWRCRQATALIFISKQQDTSLSQQQCSPIARLHPNVRATYSALYQSGELVTGVDNVFYSPVCAPSRHHAPHIQDTASRLQTQDSLKTKTENSFWPHADQNQRAPESGSWDVYQGIVYVWPSEPSSAFPDTSTTVLLPKSHRDWYPQLMAATSPHSHSHYCEIANLTDQNAAADLGELFRQGCRRAPMPEGSLLLWNSKTLHQGWTSGRRLAQPVCWEPAARRDHAALVRKAAMSIRGLPSTHWASLGKTGQRAHLCAVL